MKKIVFMFDGQGAFKPGVGRELYQRYKRAKEIIDRASKILGYNLTNYLWGEEANRTSSLTSIAQPAISAVSLAYAEVLAEFGIAGEVNLGHSLGEVTAIGYTKTLSFEDSIRVIQKRGELMEKAGKDGAMIAVINVEMKLLESECQKISQEISEPLVVANINAPNQIVVSGSKEGVKRIATFAAEKRGKGIILDTGGAWHSPYLKTAAEEFAQFLETINFKTPELKIYSVVAQKVLNSGKEVKESLKGQMLAPVNWLRAVDTLRKLGYGTFLEIGPSRILKDLVTKIAPDLKTDSTALYTDLEALVKSL